MSDLAKVYLTDDYYLGEGWNDYDTTNWGENGVFTIPRQQRDRWQAAVDAYEEMQAEIRELLTKHREQWMAERAEQQERRQAREALLIRPWRKT